MQSPWNFLHLQIGAVLFLPLQSAFFFLSIMIARVSNTLLNMVVRKRCPCLVPDLRRKAYSFHP